MTFNAYTIIALVFGLAFVYSLIKSAMLLRELNNQLNFMSDWNYRATTKKIKSLASQTNEPLLLSKIKEAALLWRLRRVIVYSGVVVLGIMALLKVPM
jgi:vacuolar-type H+-ATPase subunit E/Vma4